MSLTYDDIRRIYRLEKNSVDLVNTGSNFDEQLAELISKERENYLDSIKKASFSKAKDFSNLKKLIEEIFQMREKKLLNKALLTTRLEDYTKVNLTDAEIETFDKLLKALTEHRKRIEFLFDEQAGKQDKSLNNLAVRIIKEVPSFIGADMKEYGPYPQAQEIILPTKVGMLLVEKGLAQKV
ncbi:MAG: hypothetical protein AABW72_02535 [archaeon]